MYGDVPIDSPSKLTDYEYHTHVYTSIIMSYIYTFFLITFIIYIYIYVLQILVNYDCVQDIKTYSIALNDFAIPRRYRVPGSDFPNDLGYVPLVKS